jgi:hypothetical protein
MRRLLVVPTLVLSALLPSVAGAVTLSFAHAGYLVVDGNYHPFDRPTLATAEEPARLHPLASDGFFLQADLAIGDCDPGDGNAGALPPGLAGLGHAQVLNLELPRRFNLRESDSRTTMTLAVCEGVPVLFASTPSGTTVCAGATALPFRRGLCPGLDKADPGHVFFNAFEG